LVVRMLKLFAALSSTILYNYFNSSTKLFSDLSDLDKKKNNFAERSKILAAYR